MRKKMYFIASLCVLSVILLTGAGKQSNVLKYGDDKLMGRKV